MSMRSTVVRLEAEVSKYVQGMLKGKQATKEVKDAADQLGRAVDDIFKDMDVAKPTKELAELAAAHQKAAKAAGMQYDAQGNLVDANGRLVSSNRAAAHGLDSFSEAVYKTEYATEQAAEAQKRAAAAAEEYASKQRAAAEKVGTGMLALGATTLAGLGAATKAAMDWESAWAGVTKTVDGTPEQMAEIETGLRNLAKTLPGTHEEIAAVAESAGALGVKRQDIIAFTKTMVDLGNTTNLSADEAATSIAQFLNVMGDAGGEVDNLGSTLVALGNDGASTEKEIMMMAQRISGAGKLVGATKPDIMALASTLASLGVQAELGGGVTSRVMQRMYSDVKSGGESLQNLARVAGVSGPAFAKAFQDSPVKAMDMVFQGLNKVKNEGGNVVQTMESLGIKGTEETGVVLRLAGAGTLLADSLKVGSKAWEENTALTAEASKRYETAESKVKIAWNNIKDAAIDAGGAILPMVADVAEAVSGLAQGFNDLPKPVQNLVVGMTGVVGVLALVGGGILTLLPKVKDARDAFKDLDTKADGSSRGLGKVAKAAGIAGAVLAGMQIAGTVFDSLLPQAETSEQLANRLMGIATGVKTADQAFDKSTFARANSFAGTAHDINNIGDALNRVINPGAEGFRDWVNETFPFASSEIKETKAAISGVDQQLASMYQSGNAKGAAQSFKSIAEAAKAQGIDLDKVVERFPMYRDAVSQAERANSGASVSQEKLNSLMTQAPAASDNAAAAQKILEGAIADTGVALGGVIDDMSKFLELLFASGMATMSSRDAAIAYNEAFKNVPATMKEIADSGGKMGRVLNDNKTDFDFNTEAGAKANAAFQDLARKGMQEVKAKADEGVGMPGLQEKLGITYTDLLTAANGMGIVGDDAIALTRKVLGIPDGVSIESWMSEQAKRTAEQTKGAMDAIDGRTVRTYTVHEEKTIKSIVTQISQQNMGETPADTAFKPGTFAPGKYTGGRISDIPGYAYGGQPGGRIAAPRPLDWRTDNVLGLVNGKPVGLQGQEWIINGKSSNDYDRELAAINAGTFPKGLLDGAASMVSSRTVMPVYQGAAAGSDGPFQMVGQLVLDSGEMLGTFRGIARREASDALNGVSRVAGGRR